MSRVSVFRKITSSAICLQFIAGTMPVQSFASNDQLRPKALRDGGSFSLLAGDIMKDGGSLGALRTFSSLVELYTENFIKGDSKGQDVGRSMGLTLLKQEGFNGSLLGHSANRKAYIKEALQLGAARETAFKRYDEIMNHRMKLLMAAGFKTVALCVGSDRVDLNQEDEISDIYRQLAVSFEGIEAKDFGGHTFYLAFEPAGKIGSGQAEDTAVIADVHQAIYEWFTAKYGQEELDRIWGVSLKVLYGASVDGKNAPGIMAVKNADGKQLVHGVLFASSGKTPSGYLAVARAVNGAAERDNAEYVCFVNLKQFGMTGEKPKAAITEYAGELLRAYRDNEIDFQKTIVAITDQDAYMRQWRDTLAGMDGFSVKGDISVKDGGAVPAIPFLGDYGRQELQGIRVLLSLDLNVSDDSGNIKSLKRLEESLPTILYYLDMGATPVIVSHNGKPKGRVVEAYKMGPIADKLQELIAKAGRDYKVKFHPDSVTEKGLKQGLNAEIEEGAANLIDDSRFFTGEEANFDSFSKDLAALADNDHFGSDAFGAYERVHASRAGSAAFIHTVAEGPLMKKEYKYLLEALEVLDGLIIGGGPKLQEKLEVVKNVARTMKSGSFLAWGSAPMGSFLKILYNLDVGIDPSRLSEEKLKAREDNLNNGRETLRISAEKGIENLFAVDFTAIDMDPTAAVERVNKKGKTESKSWIEWKEVPEGAKVMNVKLVVDEAPAEGGPGKGRLVDKATGETLDASKIYLVDIGEETRALFAKRIMSTEKGKAVFHNGTVGIFEIPLFASGGKAVDEAMAMATRDKGVITVIGGGDTVKEAEKNKVDKLVTHCATGGGSSAALLKGETLKVARALDKLQSAIGKNLAKFGAAQKEFMRFIAGNKRVFTITGGQEFRKFVNAVKRSGPEKGYLDAKSSLDSEIISDSRGNPTVRALLKVNGLETAGEVPAGASTGSDEARAIKPASKSPEDMARFAEEIKAGIAAVEKVLKESNLDLGRYDDLKQALRLVRKAAGTRYENIPANVTVPVSYALWRMSARLNGKELWEYIRWNEPELAGKGKVAYYLNIFNGGLHAIKEGEKLGVHRIDFQEIMGVVEGLSEAEKLALADALDLELEKLLLAEVTELSLGTESITRADEAGFSVKGLGSSDRAIELVSQAIGNVKKQERFKDAVVELALDVASTSFVEQKDDGSYVYNFQGREMTSSEMIEYYVELAKKYNGGPSRLIRSFEDPLAEDDWENWPVLTARLAPFGILTIGDDLFVTQMERLRKGVETKAATAILIKVNQNGLLSRFEDGDGTLDVIKFARDNGLEVVVSHRSGETTDDGIADIARAVNAMGIKTGDSQRPEAFPDRSTWVRRNKYLRMGEIEKNYEVRGFALLVPASYFSVPGAVTALNVASQLEDRLKIVIYGENAEAMRTLIKNKSVIAAEDILGAIEVLKAIGIPAEKIVQVQDPAGKNAADDSALQSNGIRQLVSGEAATLTAAKAIKEALGGEEADKAFSGFYGSLADSGVISQEDYERNKAVMLSGLETQTLKLPSMEISMNESMKEQFNEAKEVTAQFLNKV